MKQTKKTFAKALVIYLLTAGLLSLAVGCSHIKKLSQKTKTSVDSTSVTKLDGTSNQKINEQISTITEKALDTTFVIPADTLTGLTPVPKVGDTSIVQDENQITFITASPTDPSKLIVHSVKKEQKIKAQVHEKTTTTHKKQTEIKTHVDKKIKADVQTQVVAKGKQVEKSTIPWYAYVIIPLFIVGMIALGVWKAKKKVSREILK